MNATVFLVDTLFSLYLMVVILRLWLQVVQADFYNPMSQFVVKATHPIVGPLRRVIPSIGRFDTATFVLAIAVCALKLITLGLMYIKPSVISFRAHTAIANTKVAVSNLPIDGITRRNGPTIGWVAFTTN